MTKMINLNDLSKEELIDNVEFIGIQLIAKENEYDELLEKHEKLEESNSKLLEEHNKLLKSHLKLMDDHIEMAKKYEKTLREYNALMKKSQAKNKPVKKMIPKLRIVA